MKRILIPVDGTKGTKEIFAVCNNIVRPAEEVILLHVEALGGKTLMVDMLGAAELATLKEAIEDTPFKERLDEQAHRFSSTTRARSRPAARRRSGRSSAPGSPPARFSGSPRRSR